MSFFGKKKSEGRGTIPIERVKALILNNVKEAEIIDSLVREGYSPEEIDKAMSQILEQVNNKPKEPAPTAPTSPPLEPMEIEKETSEPIPVFAPLFVKLERYREILGSLNELKGTLESIRNAFMMLNEMDRLRYENMKIVQGAIDAVDERLKSLDSEFVRPVGFDDQNQTVPYAEGLEGELEALKGQVEQLRGDLKTLI
jgi:hypothetical protein